ncbi:MAG: fumarate hydratase C-terminal domain-containing protein [Patescibacteria group bacterium]|jgi:fumarate hydratase subunit beta
MSLILTTPISDLDIKKMSVRDIVYISGYIYAGRDSVLPKIVDLIKKKKDIKGVNLVGSVIFHTAVSSAGVGPTSSNKVEIESSFFDLSRAGVKIHLGKGALGDKTVKILKKFNSVYAVVPPISALLSSKILEKKIVAFPEEGMEALHLLKVEKLPIIVAIANGESIYSS